MEAVMRKAAAYVVVCAGAFCLVALGGCSKGTSLPTQPWAVSRTYQLVAAWGDSGSGNGQFYYPQGVAVDAAGDVYVVDSGNHRIQKLAGDGTYITQWGTPGPGDGQFY